MAAAQCELINPHNPQRRSHHRFGQGADQPDQCHPVHRDGQPVGESGAGPSADCQGDRPQSLPKPDAASAVTDRQAGNLLGEGLLGAGVVAAEEPTNLQVDQGLLAADRGVGQSPLISAVHPS